MTSEGYAHPFPYTTFGYTSIADHVEANRSNVSRHLAVMRNAGLVAQRKDGLKMMYSLRTPCILSITQCVIGVLRERADETNEILGTLS